MIRVFPPAGIPEKKIPVNSRNGLPSFPGLSNKLLKMKNALFASKTLPTLLNKHLKKKLVYKETLF